MSIDIRFAIAALLVSLISRNISLLASRTLGNGGKVVPALQQLRREPWRLRGLHSHYKPKNQKNFRRCQWGVSKIAEDARLQSDQNPAQKLKSF